MTTDELIPKTKLHNKLKSRMIAVDSSTMDEKVFLYSIGYNNAVSSIIIDIATGEFNPDK